MKSNVFRVCFSSKLIWNSLERTTTLNFGTRKSKHLPNAWNSQHTLCYFLPSMSEAHSLLPFNIIRKQTFKIKSSWHTIESIESYSGWRHYNLQHGWCMIN